VNIPNVITTLRILLLPLFITLLVYRRPLAALVVLCLAALSDALDGLMARLFDQKTAIGTFLDPLADKLLSVSAFVTLTLIGPLPAWFVIIVISRDIIISLGSLVLYLHEGRLEIAPSRTGKLATAAQFLVILVTIAFQITGRGAGLLRALLVCTAALSVVSGVQYLWRGLNRAGTKSASA
jgi:cardiolipin synthase